jgi:hypothetical protein
MTESQRTCSIGGCRVQIPTSSPICAGHRERLSAENGQQSLVSKIDHEFLRRQQGHRGAALKYAEAISEATAWLHDGPPQPKPRQRR